MEFVTLTTRQLDYLARQDHYLEPIFRGVFASDQLPKEKDVRPRSAYIVNVDTHDKPGSHWISIFVEKDQCQVFDSYGLPIKWYKPSPFVKWTFKHYDDVSSNKGQLQATDSNTCGRVREFKSANFKGRFFILNFESTDLFASLVFSAPVPVFFLNGLFQQCKMFYLPRRRFRNHDY